jgi:hypothetical protein
MTIFIVALLAFVAGWCCALLIIYVENSDVSPSRTVTIEVPPGLIGPILKGIQHG